MDVSATTPLIPPTTMTPSPAVREAAAATVAEGRESARAREGHRHEHGRSHVQRELKHLVRDIRLQVRDEIKELKASGAEGSDEKIAAVREAFHDFRDQVQSAFKGAGRGHDFNGGSLPDSLAQAMASFTAALRAINGTEAPVEAPAAEPVADAPAATEPAVDPAKLPTPEVTGPTGNLLDVSA